MTIQLFVIDNSALIRTSLLRLLENTCGVISMDQAPALAEALVSLGHKPPGLVVVDLQLPDILRACIIRALRARLPALRVAVLTDDASALVRTRCASAGVDWLFDRAPEFGHRPGLVRRQAH